MIKRILIPLDPSPYCKQALDVAIDVARLHNAELTGLVVLDIPGIADSIGPIPVGASYYAKQLEKAKTKEARTRIKDLISYFKNVCSDAGIHHREHEAQGMPSNKIISESMFYDLLVIGMKTYFHHPYKNDSGDNFDDILDHSITPVMAIPEQTNFPKKKEDTFKAVIAFDGSLEACRAMQKFTELSSLYTRRIELHIVTSNENKETAEHFQQKAEDYLKAHSINVYKKHISSRNIIQLIDEDYINWAHMIILGAHLKKGLFDFVSGSLMRYLIKESKVPLFIGL